jgi:glycosyltransferase involved in cell wall biosynthesis
MNGYPRITVVTPSFNRAEYLEETLMSVVHQDYPNLEYIVIDGGSTDGSAEIIQRHASNLAYWVSERDAGPADAIRKGFDRATGSILAWLNSDDTYQPGTLAAVAEAFGSGQTADVVYGNMYWVSASGDFLAEKRQAPFWKPGYQYGGADLQQPATFWKRDLYVRSGGIDPSFQAAFDTDLFFRFIELGARFHHIDTFLASFRVHPGQISELHLEAARSEVERIRAQHLRFSATSLPGRLVKNAGRLQRIAHYAVRGDLGWLLSRIPDRVRSVTANEATGPKSRGI